MAMILKTARLSEGTTWRLCEKSDLSLVYHLKMENPSHINHSTWTCGFFLSRLVAQSASCSAFFATSLSRPLGWLFVAPSSRRNAPRKIQPLNIYQFSNWLDYE